MPISLNGSSQSPWVGGLGALAEAISQVPANRARVRQMELSAANAAADNARADQALALQQQNAIRQAQQWQEEQAIRQSAEARAAAEAVIKNQGLTLGNESQSLAIDFAKAHNPLALQQDQLNLGKTQQEIDFNAANNPLLIQKNDAEAQKGIMENNLERARISQLPALSGSLTDAVYAGVHDKMQPWDLASSLQKARSVLPETGSYSAGQYEAPPSLPGVSDSGMDYPGMLGGTSGMDEMSRRMGVHDQIANMADSAVMSDPKLDQAKWIKDQTASMSAVDPSASVADAAKAGPDFGNNEYGKAAIIVANLRQKERDGIPLTPYEKDTLALALNTVNHVVPSTTMTTEGPVTTVSTMDPFKLYGSGGVPAASGGQQPQSAPGSANVSAGQPTQSVSGTAGGQPSSSVDINGVNVTTYGKRPEKPRTEYENKAMMYATRTGVAFKQLAPLMGLNLETGEYDPSKATVSGALDAAQMVGDRVLSGVIGPEFRGAVASDDQQQYANASISLGNALVRFDSGAATPEVDYDRARQDFLPGPMDSPKAKFDKIIRVQATIKAMEEIGRMTGIDPADATDAQLQQWRPQIRAAVERNISEIAAGQAPAGSPAPGSSPPSPAQAASPAQEEEWGLDAQGNPVRKDQPAPAQEEEWGFDASGKPVRIK